MKSIPLLFTTGLFLLLSVGCSEAREPAESADATSNMIEEPRALEVPDNAPMYCRDDSGAFQPMVRTDYGRLKESFMRQFGWSSSLTGTSPTIGELVFSEDGTKNAPEMISYVVQPNDGGIVLLHMKTRLEGFSENLSGTAACLQTFGIIHVQ